MRNAALVIGIGCLAASGAFLTACTDPANNANSANTTVNGAPSNSANSSNAGNAANNPAGANVANTANTAEPVKPFSKTLELQGIKFKIESPNAATGNKVTVTPSGLEITNEAATRDVDGAVYEAEIEDLNADGSPEVYVYVRGNGPDKRASLVAYSANKKKSMSEISMPAVDPQSKDFAGYNGEDEFAVVENTLVRRFPVFDGTGANAKKTGKTRQIQYKLKPGEAAWQLYPDKVVEY